MEFTVDSGDVILTDIEDKSIRKMVAQWDSDLKSVDSALKFWSGHLKEFVQATQKLTAQCERRIKDKSATAEQQKLLQELIDHAEDVRRKIARMDLG